MSDAIEYQINGTTYTQDFLTISQTIDVSKILGKVEFKDTSITGILETLMKSGKNLPELLCRVFGHDWFFGWVDTTEDNCNFVITKMMWSCRVCKTIHDGLHHPDEERYYQI